MWIMFDLRAALRALLLRAAIKLGAIGLVIAGAILLARAFIHCG
jgi:hypothetical protein